MMSKQSSKNNSESPRMMLIFSGPKWDLDRDCGTRLRQLSERFAGVSLVAHNHSAKMTYDRFCLTAVKFQRGGFRFSLRFFAFGLWWAACERLRQGQIALVVTTDPLKTGVLGWLVAKIVGAKFVPEVNGDFWNRANYLDGTSRLAGWFKRKVLTVIGTFVLARADGIRILYPGQLDFLQHKLAGKIVRSIFDFTDISPFHNYGEDKVVLFAGFPFYLKGVDILIDAFKRVSPKHPEWTLKILGWFPDPALLNARCEGNQKIVLHRPVHHREMPEHIGRSAIVVLPSRSEGMGRVLIEAMAAGKPRIGANVGGIFTVIDNGKDGLLFESGSVGELAAHLDTLMANGKLRKAIGEAGRQRAVQEFTLDNYLDKTIDFYMAVINRA